MGFPIQIDTIMVGSSIIHFKGSLGRVILNMMNFDPSKIVFILANSVNPGEMPLLCISSRSGSTPFIGIVPTCVIKIVTFKGGHLMWFKWFSKL